jgi:hypothetical protein
LGLPTLLPPQLISNLKLKQRPQVVKVISLELLKFILLHDQLLPLRTATGIAIQDFDASINSLYMEP